MIIKWKSIPVHCVFDNEEVGSGTKQGAASTFLADTLIRINHAMGRDEAGYRQSIANSFMLSADNAHGVHPNHTDKACPTNRPYPGNGVVIKYSANQKYTTDAVSAAVFEEIATGQMYRISLREPFRYTGRFHTREYFHDTGISQHSRHRTGSARHAFPILRQEA